MITNEQIKQYEPLVHKIAHQLTGIVTFEYDDVVQYGFEGLINAYNTYKQDMNQTFIQYAGWQIRYAILNANNSEGGVIKQSYYHRKNCGSLSIDYIDSDKYYQLKYSENCNIEYILNFLEKKLSKKFSVRDCDIFYRSYGLKQYDYEKFKDIAEVYNISCASVTLINQKIINYIKSNEELMSILQDMLN